MIRTYDADGGPDNDADGTEYDVAIVGMSGRFPGAPDLPTFWANLRDGVESIRRHSEAELLAAGVDPALVADPDYVGASATLDDADRFDATFFGYSAREAELLDPQQRLLLECAWEALESSGYDPGRIDGAVGVYTGTGMSTYLLFNLLRATGQVSMTDDALTVMMGNDKGFASTRIAYHLGLRGASVDVNSACSTSLVAVATAYQALLTYQCDMALAGGAAVNLSQGPGYLHHDGGPASRDGHCRPFDHRAQGTVFGSGVGVVVLKRLEDAISDGDTIRAVIRSAAVNNDGNLKVGYTAPSVRAQAEVIAEALAAAGVEPRTIGYVEAHGTGTELGDPIEVAALTKAFRAGTADRGFCALGSVKANIGHLDAAAGMAGLMKAVLALEHAQIPPTPGFEKPNPALALAESPFYVNTTLREWPERDTPRRAGVSSFGFGGTNVHLILQSAPEPEPAAAGTPALPWQVIPVSARTPDALDQATDALVRCLRAGDPVPELADVAYTLRNGRRAFEYRRTVVAADTQSAAAALDSARATRAGRALDNPSVVLMLPGQGAQYAGMAGALYEHVPVFRAAVDRCAQSLQPHLGLDIRDILCGSATGRDRTADIDQTALAQPALFVTEYALATTLIEWGLRPEAIIGHSVGEYVAATLAGVLDLPDALAVIAARGRLVQALPTGDMLTVELSREQLEPRLVPGVSVAVANGATSHVLAGPAAAVIELENRLTADGVACRRLSVSHAFHTPMMEDAREALRREFGGVELRAPKIPYASNVTGDWITAEEATDPAYWARHLCQTVQFDRGLRTVLAGPDRVLVECGPGRGLGTLARHHPNRPAATVVVSLMPGRGREGQELPVLLAGLGALWSAGAAIDWDRVYGERRRRVPLPTYPFQRRRYWIDPEQTPASPEQPSGGAAAARHSPDPQEWLHVPSWKRSLPAAASPTGGAPGGHWLILGDGSPLTGLLSARCAENAQVTVAHAGDTFRYAEGDVRLRPANAADHLALLRELDRKGTPLTGIIHLWGVTDEPSPDPAAAMTLSVLALADALVRHERKQPISLTIATCGAQAVTGEEELRPERAGMLGAARVIPQEVPGLTCRTVDLDPGSVTDRSGRRAVDQIMRETAVRDEHPVVAYRGRYRWVQEFAPVRPAPAADRRPRKRGSYLVTGAFGRVGTVVADHLARDYQARLTLVARTPLPAAASWDDWLERHGAQDPVSVRIRAVRALEELGAQVEVVRADVTDRSQLSQAVDRARTRFGRIDGVVHGVGLTGDAAFLPIGQTDPVAAESILRSRTAALPWLAELLADDEPDFCLVHSSLASVLGGPGLAAYAAGNAYLDAFVHAMHAQGRCGWTAVDWDTWRLDAADAGTGTGAQPEAARLDASAGAALLDRLAGLDGVPQVLVSVEDLDHRVQRWLRTPTTGDAPSDGRAVMHPRPDLLTPYAPPQSDLERQITELWEELLHISPVGVDDPFFDLGGDSVLATRLLARLRAKLSIEIPLATLFDSPTIRACASAIGRSAAVAATPIAPLPRTTRISRSSLSPAQRSGTTAIGEES